ECPKCGNREAYVWMMQTRAADEPPTRFYRCTKCGYTWREYE
ncbi:MAG: transcription factor S, partial [Thermoprotei archaeon]|nr:transcription factor S [Thermoprotei archaeon]